MENETSSSSVVAWLLLAVGTDRAFGGNDGYKDEPDRHYRWDSTVPNHAKLGQGDIVVLWDKKTSIGMSVIDAIDIRQNTKPIYRCRVCNRASIKKRKTLRPLYRCASCKRAFDDPWSEVIDVTEYQSTHLAQWTSLDGVFKGSELRAVCKSPNSQLSLRPLDWTRFVSLCRSQNQAIQQAESLMRSTLHRK